jgi:hypothetical protein
MVENRYYNVLLFLIALFIAVTPIKAGRVFRGGRVMKGKNNDPASFPYLYATRTDYNASFPVVEYIAPARQKDLENDRPGFLYGPRQGFRIVVFVS